MSIPNWSELWCNHHLEDVHVMVALHHDGVVLGRRAELLLRGAPTVDGCPPPSWSTCDQNDDIPNPLGVTLLHVVLVAKKDSLCL
eukprot:5148524-Amphidinium_carterae.1